MAAVLICWVIEIVKTYSLTDLNRLNAAERISTFWNRFELPPTVARMRALV